jgi:hypothetical protein
LVIRRRWGSQGKDGEVRVRSWSSPSSDLRVFDLAALLPLRLALGDQNRIPVRSEGHIGKNGNQHCPPHRLELIGS